MCCAYAIDNNSTASFFCKSVIYLQSRNYLTLLDISHLWYISIELYVVGVLILDFEPSSSLLQHAMLFFLHYWELPTAAIRYNFPRQRAIPVQGDDLQEQLAELPANVQENQVPPPMLELSDDEDLAEVQPVEPIQTHSRQQQRTEIDQRSPYETIATQHISGSSHVDTEGHESGMYTYNEQFSKEECNIGAPSALVTTSMKIRDQLSRCSKTDSTNQTNVSVTNDPLIGSTQPEPGAYPVERVQCIETENLGEHARL